jgi:N-acetylneuraminate synthase/sialic acid synthase
MKSPGDGLPPYELDRVIGRRLLQPVSEDQALTFEILEEKAQPALAGGHRADAA